MVLHPWQAAFSELEGEGPDKIAKLFKIGLKEVPRLEKQLTSPVKEEKDRAREETIELFEQINQAMKQEIKNGSISPEEFARQMRQKAHFTAEELGHLAKVPELIGESRHELFAQRALGTFKQKARRFKV